MSEKRNIEYKRSYDSEYLKWICSFANPIKGLIYVGKDDRGNVVGLFYYERSVTDDKVSSTLIFGCNPIHSREGTISLFSTLAHNFNYSVNRISLGKGPVINFDQK